MNEQWKWIPGFENLYKISDLGHVWSCRSGKVMKAHPAPKYLAVTLSSKTQPPRNHYIQVLVAEAFLECPNPDYIVSFKDGNCLNAKADNLEYISRSELRKRYPQMSIRYKRGEAHHQAVLTEEQVEYIIKSPERHHILAQELGVTQSTVHGVRYNETWTHLDRSEAAELPPRWFKLSPEAVEEIRKSDEMGTVLAEEYGVSKSMITRIRKGERR